MKIEKRIASSLLQARQRAGLSLRQLAARADTSHSTLIAYAKGRKIPTAPTYFRILEACSFAVDVVLSPRIRSNNDVPRGEELVAVLELAEQFPHRASRHLEYPSLRLHEYAG